MNNFLIRTRGLEAFRIVPDNNFDEILLILRFAWDSNFCVVVRVCNECSGSAFFSGSFTALVRGRPFV